MSENVMDVTEATNCFWLSYIRKHVPGISIEAKSPWMGSLKEVFYHLLKCKIHAQMLKNKWGT